MLLVLGLIAVHCQSSIFVSENWKPTHNGSIVMPRFEPGAVRWEAQSLTLCFAAPPPFGISKVFYSIGGGHWAEVMFVPLAQLKVRE